MHELTHLGILAESDASSRQEVTFFIFCYLFFHEYGIISVLRLIKSLQKSDTSNSEFDLFLCEDFQI